MVGSKAHRYPQQNTDPSYYVGVEENKKTKIINREREGTLDVSCLDMNDIWVVHEKRGQHFIDNQNGTHYCETTGLIATCSDKPGFGAAWHGHKGRREELGTPASQGTESAVALDIHPSTTYQGPKRKTGDKGRMRRPSEDKVWLRRLACCYE